MQQLPSLNEIENSNDFENLLKIARLNFIMFSLKDSI